MLLIEHSTLLSRLVNGVTSGRNFVFLLGSGISVAETPGGPGVPLASEILQTIKARVGDEGIDSYQSGFERIVREFDPDEPNRVIREAVLKAHLKTASLTANSPDEALEALEANPSDWYQPTALRAMTALIAMHPKSFGRTILTTNFDPLIQLCLSQGQKCWHAIYLHEDGSLMRAKGSGSAIVHLHGHWVGSDTLHTPSQLTTPRKQLSSSLKTILSKEGTTVIVLGYGGWTDVATDAIDALIQSDNSKYDIIWCFFSTDEAGVRSRYPQVIRMMERANARGRGHCVLGIDGNKMLPQLVLELRATKPAQDVKTYLDLETDARVNRFYHYDNSPWSMGSSIGDSLTGLSTFGMHVAAAAALAAVELELPNLEGQPIHQATVTTQYDWVRPAIEAAFEALGVLDERKALDFRKCSERAYQAQRSVEEVAGQDSSRERQLLRAVDLAFAATAAALRGSEELSDQGLFSATTLAKKALHLVWRCRREDELLFQQIKPRLLIWDSQRDA